MGDHQGGGPVGQGAERRFDFLFGGEVEIGGGFVQHQDARLIHQDARDLQALAFSHGEADAALTDFGGEALGKAVEEIGEAGANRGVAHLLVCGDGAFVADVFGQGSAENGAIGGDHPNGAADRRRVNV